MDSNKSKKDLIPWIIVGLLLSAIVIISTVIFVNSEKAILGISVASTLVSIILAVLAIIYTYIDSSSSKENIYQMRDITKKLENSVQEEKELIKNFSEEIQKVLSLKDELLESISFTEQWRNDVMDHLKATAGNDKNKILFNVSQIEEAFNENKLDRKASNIADSEVESYVRFLLRNNKRRSLMDLLLDISNTYKISTTSADRICRRLMQKDIIKRDENQKYYLAS